MDSNKDNNHSHDKNNYVHDKVSITIDDKKVDIPAKPSPSEDPTAFLVSYRTGEKVPISKIQKLYDIYGSYAKVSKEVGISDKTIKRYVKERAPIESAPSEHLTQAEKKGFKETKVSRTQHVAVKASRIADTFLESNSNVLDETMSVLLESLSDEDVIRKAPLRDRAIAWGIVAERLQKAKELAIRQSEAETKRYEITRKDEELELRKREIAALEKGVTIKVERNFQDVSKHVDVDIVESDDEKSKG